MPHREHQYELLSAYLDGELTPAQARGLEEALADDPALRAELERLKRARHAVRTLPHQAAPSALAERVLGQIERGSVLAGTSTPTGRRSHWAFYTSVAAAAVVLIGLGLGAYLLLRQPSYLEKQLLAQKEAPAELAGKAVIVPSSEPQPELAALPRSGQIPSPADEDKASPAVMGDRARDSASDRPGQTSGQLTSQGPPLYEPGQAGQGERMAVPALAAAPASAAAPAGAAAVSTGMPMAGSVQTTRAFSTMAEARPATYFDLAEPDLRLVIRVKNLPAAQEYMRQVLEVAKQAHVAAAGADLGGAMCVSFNGRIVRQDGAIQYEFRIHPRAMPPLVRALTEMESLEQSWQVLQSPRPLESKWQVLRECLGEALAASQPVRDRVVISRQELPATRSAAGSIEMFSTFSLVDSAATATAPSGPSGPPPEATSAATRPAQQWLEPYNLIVRIEASAADNATTNLAPATSATTAASRPAP